MHVAINQWPAAERPREKLLTRGAGALSDAELLAIFLRTGVAGKTAVDVARELLSHFGSLRQLLAADYAAVAEAPGLGPAKYAQLQAAVEMSRRYLGERLQRDVALSSPEAVKDFLMANLRDLPHEVFCALFLDARNRLLAFERLFDGSIRGATVYPREIIKHVLKHNASAVIFAHNHPSGDAQPSSADIELTTTLKEALQLIDVQVLDHFVIGDGEAVSFCEQGLL